jgi:hypothetical protein
MCTDMLYLSLVARQQLSKDIPMAMRTVGGPCHIYIPFNLLCSQSKCCLCCVISPGGAALNARARPGCQLQVQTIMVMTAAAAAV